METAAGPFGGQLTWTDESQWRGDCQGSLAFISGLSLYLFDEGIKSEELELQT